MKQTIYVLALTIFLMSSCGNKTATTSENKSFIFCTDKCESKTGSKELSCKLTNPELQKRKAIVLENLKKQVLEKKELNNGYDLKFPGTDRMIDELTEFEKTERICCDFFTFNRSMCSDTSFVWFEIIGSKGAKEFIKTEMEL